MDLHRRVSPGPQVLVESRKKRRVETQTNQCTQVGQTKGSSSRKVPAALVFTETSLPRPGSSLAQWEDFQSAELHCFLVLSIWIWDFLLNSYGWISEIQVDTMRDRIRPGCFSCCGWWEKLERSFSLCWSPRVRGLLRYPRDKQETTPTLSIWNLFGGARGCGKRRHKQVSNVQAQACQSWLRCSELLSVVHC